jgi:hypothetical protein
MRKVTDISFDYRVPLQTLYRRLRDRDIPTVLDADNQLAVEEEHIPLLLEVKRKGRKSNKAKEAERVDKLKERV